MVGGVVLHAADADPDARCPCHGDRLVEREIEAQRVAQRGVNAALGLPKVIQNMHRQRVNEGIPIDVVLALQRR